MFKTKPIDKKNLRIGTRVCLVFSIYDNESGEILATGGDEAMMQMLFEKITGEKYTAAYGMELVHDRN